MDFLDRTLSSPAPPPLAPGQAMKLLAGAAAPGRVAFREKPVNRLAFQRALAIQADSGKAFAVILINVEGMARINAQFGFQTGDVVLEEFSLFLSRFMPHTSIVAHMFGDEFAVLIPGVAAAHEAESMTVRVARALDKPLIIDERSVRISVSMGLAHSPEWSTPCGDWLQAAARALYLAKQAEPVHPLH
jgi:diguanylate cyclase (GGDEF)-like protein